MRVLLQRVSEASVTVEEKMLARINKGLLLLVGVEEADEKEDADWLVKKITQMRIFPDVEGVMNLSLLDVDGEALVISQFTLHASTKKGNRPSYIKAAKPPLAVDLYEYFKTAISETMNKPIASGLFGADMKVSLINDGPVTIWLDSKNKA